MSSAEREDRERRGIGERVREALGVRRRAPAFHEAGHPPPLTFAKPERAETYVKSVADAILEGRPPSVIALLILDYFKTSIDEWFYAATTTQEEYAFERYVHVAAMLARSLNAMVTRRLAEAAASDERVRRGWRDVYQTFIAALVDAELKFLSAVAGVIRLNKPASSQLAWSKYGFVKT
jgi:hypothetical protein